jgi:hypothetical protein
VLFDVSTLYLETDAGDGFREPSNYAEPAAMPRSWWRWWWSCSPPATAARRSGNREMTKKTSTPTNPPLMPGISA